MLRRPIASHYLFDLFVAGSTSASLRALNVIHTVCRDELEGNDIWLRVVDISAHLDQAVSSSVVATPTLVRVVPWPSVRVVGKFGSEELLSMMKVEETAK
jgi:circadian clock protein KaiB